MSRVEFWSMPPRELWWFLAAKIPDLLDRPSEADKWGDLLQLAENWRPKE